MMMIYCCTLYIFKGNINNTTIMGKIMITTTQKENFYKTNKKALFYSRGWTLTKYDHRNLKKVLLKVFNSLDDFKPEMGALFYKQGASNSGYPSSFFLNSYYLWIMLFIYR